jgi:hypothetical protein
VAAGGSPKTLQTILGHRSAAFSSMVYAHLFDVDLDALADRLDTRAANVKSHHPCLRLAPVGVSHILAFLGFPFG